jgi:pimeloyl-ACP methyl ester carboxylesterase
MMQRVTVGGITLEYEDRGSGEAVVFVHGVLVADAFLPLASEPILSTHHLITYRRRGYGNSSPVGGPVSVAESAADCLGLLRSLGVERAHVVGHSYGGAVALQAALRAPDRVRSLVLIEPALAIGATGEAYRASLTAAVDRFRRADAAALVDAFLEARTPGYRRLLDERLPGAIDQANADARTSFEADIQGLVSWRFAEEEAGQVRRPVLSILGGDSNALWLRFGEVHEWLLKWLPNAEGQVVPGTTHLLQIEKPAETAAAIAAFLSRVA